MIAGEIIIRAGDLLALSKKPLCDIGSGIIPLFGQCLAIPNKIIGGHGYSILQFNDLRPPSRIPSYTNKLWFVGPVMLTSRLAASH